MLRIPLEDSQEILKKLETNFCNIDIKTLRDWEHFPERNTQEEVNNIADNFSLAGVSTEF